MCTWPYNMKIDIPDIPFPIIAGAGIVYSFWYWWYYCVQHGDRVYAQPAIYPPLPIQAPPPIPLYLPRPPLLPGPSSDTCGFPCGIFNPPGCDYIPPPVCQANPQCPAGSVVNPMTCQCVPECYIVQNMAPYTFCPQGSHWNWCVKGCVPDGSLIPDCNPPTC